ncbi:MAG TPA: SRPBCC family protein [Vulgatibacter sp.]|nr:SRPBCC family protein [Vulgatibacter sp.]
MDLSAEASIAQPRDAVFRVYRDELVNLLPYLPNVRRIEVKSREEKGDRVALVNVWHGGGEIPAAVRKFLSDSMLSWTDYAEWDEAEHACTWRSESHSFKDAVHSQGRNVFLEDGPGRSIIRIGGRIDVDAARIKGVPSLLAGGIGPVIERFLVKQVQDNLQEVARGVDRYLRENPR